MEDCEQRTGNVPPHITPPKMLHEGCNLHGAGGRARSPTLWGGTSQETPYLAYGPEPDISPLAAYGGLAPLVCGGSRRGAQINAISPVQENMS